MYIEYTYNLHFFDGHRASYLWFIKHYHIKKTEKIMQIPPIKSPPFSNGSNFSYKKPYVYDFVSIIHMAPQKHLGYCI